MKVTFEVSRPPDKYETGRIKLTATRPQEIIKLLDKDRKLKADPALYAEALTCALQSCSASYTDPDPHFLIESTLVAECTAPYIKGIEKLVGAPIPEFYTAQIDLLPAFSDRMEHLPLLKAELLDGSFSFALAYEDHYKKEEDSLDLRFQKAERGALDQLEGIVNVRPYHKEYIEKGNGTYRKNPLYATGNRLPVNYCIGHVKLWDLLLMWWKDNVATPLQKAAVEEIVEGGPDKSQAHLLSYGGGLTYYPEYTLYLPDANGPVVYGSGRVPRVRIIKDLTEKSLEGWTPGVNIAPATYTRKIEKEN